MKPKGDVQFRTKLRATWQIPAFISGVWLFLAVWAPLQGLGLGVSLGFGLFSLLLGLVFSVVRVTVSSEFVDIDYGLIGPKIPLAAIESVTAIGHKYGGVLRWGVSPIGVRKWLYLMPGDQGRAVKIEWRDRKGDRRVHIISSRDNEQLANAIQSARATAAIESEAGGIRAAPSRALQAGKE